MATDRLFGNNIPPACRYCREAYPDAQGKYIMCVKRGIVSPDYKCRHFLYDPLLRVPKKPLALEKFSPDEFSLD